MLSLKRVHNVACTLNCSAGGDEKRRFREMKRGYFQSGFLVVAFASFETVSRLLSREYLLTVEDGSSRIQSRMRVESASRNTSIFIEAAVPTPVSVRPVSEDAAVGGASWKGKMRAANRF
jgi:hypothetical protein